MNTTLYLINCVLLALSLVCSPKEFLAEGVGEVVVSFLQHGEAVRCACYLHGSVAGQRHCHTINAHLNPLRPSVDGDFNHRVFAHNDGSHGERVRRDWR